MTLNLPAMLLAAAEDRRDCPRANQIGRCRSGWGSVWCNQAGTPGPAGCAGNTINTIAHVVLKTQVQQTVHFPTDGGKVH